MLILNQIQILTQTLLSYLFLNLIRNSLVLIQIATTLHCAPDMIEMTLLV